MNEMYISSHQENKKKTFLENCLSLLLLKRDTKREREGKNHASIFGRKEQLIFCSICVYVQYIKRPWKYICIYI